MIFFADARRENYNIMRQFGLSVWVCLSVVALGVFLLTNGTTSAGHSVSVSGHVGGAVGGAIVGILILIMERLTGRNE